MNKVKMNKVTDPNRNVLKYDVELFDLVQGELFKKDFKYYNVVSPTIILNLGKTQLMIFQMSKLFKICNPDDIFGDEVVSRFGYFEDVAEALAYKIYEMKKLHDMKRDRNENTTFTDWCSAFHGHSVL